MTAGGGHARGRRRAAPRTLALPGLALLLLLAAAPSLAQPAPADPEPEEAASVGSGSEDVVEVIEEIDTPKRGTIPLPVVDDIFRTWTDFKGRVDDDLHLRLATAWTVLYQRASNSPGNQQGASAIFELPGTWALLGRGTRYEGRLGFKVEDRHRVGTDIPAQRLSTEIGSSWQTGTGYTSFDIALVELWWEQQLHGDRAVFRIGKVLPNTIYDYHEFKSFRTGYNNAAFSRSPVLVQPSFGPGAVVRLAPTTDTYLLAGIHDANSGPRDHGLDSFFNRREYFMALELGWEPELDVGRGRYHVLAWRVDRRNRDRVPGAWGITGLAEQRFGRLVPFLRWGYAQDQATTVEHLVAVGVSLTEVFGHSNDVIGLGLSWGEPTRSDRRDQWAGELFYRVQLLPNLQVTPSIQGILDPAANRKHAGIAVFSLRARVSF